MAIVSDIPATRPWLTVVDLIDSGEELSLVANVLADALERGLVAGMPAGASLYDSLARRREE